MAVFLFLMNDNVSAQKIRELREKGSKESSPSIYFVLGLQGVARIIEGQIFQSKIRFSLRVELCTNSC